MKIMGFPMSKASRILNSIPKDEDFPEWTKQMRWNAFKFHYKHNTSYRSFVGNDFPGKWADIPIIQKQGFKKNNISIKPTNRPNFKYYFQSTSGSSGTPFTFATDYLSHALTWQFIRKRYSETGVELNDLQARFYALPGTFRKKTEEKIKDFLVNRYRFPITDLSDNQLQEWTRDLKKKKYKYIYGYTFPLLTYAEYLRFNNLVLKDIIPFLKSCIITSEICTREEHKKLEKYFGIPVYNEYGTSELGIIGFGKTGQWKLSEELMYIEILDEKNNPVEDGESGRIVCTPFFQKGSPFVRYDVGDFGAITTINGTRQLTHLDGRKETLLKLASGRKIPGDTLFHIIFKDFFKNNPDLIHHFQAIQTQKNRIEISIVSIQPITEYDIDKLKKSINNYLYGEVEIIIKQVSEIERTNNLKFQRFISLV
jgi:phenylacetate-CoA ligase